MKIPNILTIGRIIIVPIFVLSFFIPGVVGDLVPFFLFVLASFTDYLDGLLARLYKEESKLGELLDPIADKILVAAALVLLIMNGIIKNYFLKQTKVINIISVPFIFVFISEIFPLRTSGSFFTTSTSTFIFILIAVIITLSKKRI